jgi:hypothetical protein
MSVQLRWYPPDGSAGTRIRAARELIGRLKAAGYWVADTGTYWNAHVHDLMADGKPVWVGRAA